MTVVLFASLFAFVTRFPAPPAQSANQFQATAVLNSTGKGITGVRILQEGGPPVPEGDRVYLGSTRATSNWQFSQASGVPVAWGTGNGTGGWYTGTYWSTTFATAIKLPANLTVYIVSTSELLYSGVVPGGSSNSPPLITSTYTIPSPTVLDTAFQIVALVSGNSTGLTMNITLSEIPGLPTTVQTMHPDGVGEWVYNASAATTTAGSYRAFIQGVNATGGTVSGSVIVTVSGSTSGSGTVPTASLGYSPNPLNVRNNVTLFASVTNPTSSSLTISNVTYYINSSASNHTVLATLYTTGTLPVVGAHAAVSVASTAWMAPGSALGGVNMTAVVSFSGGTHALAAVLATLTAAPFSATVSVVSVNSTITEKGAWNILTTVANFGSLGHCTVNITVYVNNTAETATEGKVVSPGNTSGNPGYATYPTTSTSSILPAMSTPTFIAGWRGGAMTSVMTISVVEIIKIANTAWSSFTTTTVTLKLTTSFSN